MINLIAAMDRNRCIGKNGSIPWHYREDLRFFKETTMYHPIIMGGATWRSIGRPLKGRVNIVVTRNPKDVTTTEAVHTAYDVWEALRIAKTYDENVYCIGGAQIYAQMFNIADRLIVTEVPDVVFGGDAYFPKIEETVWHNIATASLSDQLKIKFWLRKP